MREHALAEWLRGTEAGEAAPVLAEVQALGRKGGPPFDIALLTAVTLLSGEALEYELRARLYLAAKEAGLEDALRLFFSSRALPAEPSPRATIERQLTLGHRKWMARSSQREVLDRLLRDPEPEVVPILLGNPRLTERDVVLLAARRPTVPSVQWEIFAARRWIARYAIKRSLVLNPYTPSELAVRLLGFLTARDLQLVATTPTLPEVVREAAARLARAGDSRCPSPPGVR